MTRKLSQEPFNAKQVVGAEVSRPPRNVADKFAPIRGGPESSATVLFGAARSPRPTVNPQCQEADRSERDPYQGEADRLNENVRAPPCFESE